MHTHTYIHTHTHCDPHYTLFLSIHLSPALHTTSPVHTSSSCSSLSSFPPFIRSSSFFLFCIPNSINLFVFSLHSSLFSIFASFILKHTTPQSFPLNFSSVHHSHYYHSVLPFFLFSHYLIKYCFILTLRCPNSLYQPSFFSFGIYLIQPYNLKNQVRKQTYTMW